MIMKFSTLVLCGLVAGAAVVALLIRRIDADHDLAHPDHPLPFKTKAFLKIMDMMLSLFDNPFTMNDAEAIRASITKLESMMTALGSISARQRQLEEDITVEDRTIPQDPPLPVRIYRPRTVAKNTLLPVVVLLHGGGWVFSGASHHICALELSDRARAVVVAVDYRLAPEHKFPAAVEDSVFATQWVYNNSASIGSDASRLVLAGDSAGGTLSAVVSQQLRGKDIVKHQFLVYPATLMTSKTQSKQEFHEGFFLSTDMMDWFLDKYFSSEDELEDVRASPYLATDFSNLPPATVYTAEYDVLRDEGELYAKKLKESGIPCEIIRYSQAIHGFFTNPDIMPAAIECYSDIARKVSRL